MVEYKSMLLDVIGINGDINDSALDYDGNKIYEFKRLLRLFDDIDKYEQLLKDKIKVNMTSIENKAYKDPVEKVVLIGQCEAYSIALDALMELKHE